MTSSPLTELFTNPSFLSAFFAWLCAQATKMICALVQTRRTSFSYLLSTGGMPSAHSAMACALLASIGLRTGMNGPLFAVAIAFAGVVMFDAQSVRRAAGQQARLLNQIVAGLVKEHRFKEQKLVELLGHTRMEVFMGMLMGIFMAFLVHAVWLTKTTGMP